MIYRALIYDKSNTFISELPFEGFSFTKKLNDIPVLELRINYHILLDWAKKQNTTVENILTSGFRWVNFKADNNTLFKGYLSEVKISKAQYDINVNLTFLNWLGYFKRRYITKTYTNTDAGSIAWDLINTAQLETYGNIGITQGIIQTTKNRDRTYTNDEVAKSIIALSNSNLKDGFEFEITNDKVFTVKSRIGTDKPYIVLDERNIESWNIDFLISTSLTNKVTLKGEGYGDSQLTVIREASNIYKDKWYLLENIISDVNVKEQTTLQDKGDKYLEKYQDVNKTFSLTTVPVNYSIFDFDVGDGVKVKIEDIIDGVYRIKTKQFSFSGDEEKIKLEFLF